MKAVSTWACRGNDCHDEESVCARVRHPSSATTSVMCACDGRWMIYSLTMLCLFLAWQGSLRADNVFVRFELASPGRSVDEATMELLRAACRNELENRGLLGLAVKLVDAGNISPPEDRTDPRAALLVVGEVSTRNASNVLTLHQVVSALGVQQPLQPNVDTELLNKQTNSTRFENLKFDWNLEGAVNITSKKGEGNIGFWKKLHLLLQAMKSGSHLQPKTSNVPTASSAETLFPTEAGLLVVPPGRTENFFETDEAGHAIVFRCGNTHILSVSLRITPAYWDKVALEWRVEKPTSIDVQTDFYPPPVKERSRQELHPSDKSDAESQFPKSVASGIGTAWLNHLLTLRLKRSTLEDGSVDVEITNYSPARVERLKIRSGSPVNSAEASIGDVIVPPGGTIRESLALRVMSRREELKAVDAILRFPVE